MAERKVSKPRVVRMWAVWSDDLRAPFTVAVNKDLALRRCWLSGARAVRVEVREVKPRKSGKGKVKRGR